MDMVPYDPQDKDRALVLDFFPLEITDNTMKMELAKRFFQVQGVVGRNKMHIGTLRWLCGAEVCLCCAVNR